MSKNKTMQTKNLKLVKESIAAGKEKRYLEMTLNKTENNVIRKPYDYVIIHRKINHKTGNYEYCK